MLICFVTPDRASRDRAEEAVAPDIVSSDASQNRAFDATTRLPVSVIANNEIARAAQIESIFISGPLLGQAHNPENPLLPPLFQNALQAALLRNVIRKESAADAQSVPALL